MVTGVAVSRPGSGRGPVTVWHTVLSLCLRCPGGGGGAAPTGEAGTVVFCVGAPRGGGGGEST